MPEYQRRLNEIEKLEKNWDSYGANALDERTIARARKFAMALVSGDATISPTNDGGVSFSWLDETVEVVFGGEGNQGEVFIEWPKDGIESNV